MRLWAAHLAILLLLPILLSGVINRTKALWAGRKGPPLLQLAFDLARLLRKKPVYSEVTTPLFHLAPLVILASTLVSGLMVPLLGSIAPWTFSFDFIAVLYLWGLGRMFLMLAALDTGSSFEGMGASREATFAALLEPAVLLALGALAAVTGNSSFAGILHIGVGSPVHVVVSVACVVTFVLVLQIEAARVPVDDPGTHLELTMIHEVMILDHSGPDLAALQYAAAMKLTLCAALVATVVNPLPLAHGVWLVGLANVGLILLVGVLIGFGESLTARLRLGAVPQYIAIALVAAFVALLSTAWRQGGIG